MPAGQIRRKLLTRSLPSPDSLRLAQRALGTLDDRGKGCLRSSHSSIALVSNHFGQPTVEIYNMQAVPKVQVRVSTDLTNNKAAQLDKDSSANKRRMQNRLNQRAHRQRRAEEKARNTRVFELRFVVSTNSVRGTSPSGRNSATPESDSTAGSRLHQPGWLSSASWCRPFEAGLIKNYAQRAGKMLWKGHATSEADLDTVLLEEGFLVRLKPSDLLRLPGDDHLLSLMYYNVFRALTWNMRSMNLDTVLMHTDEYPSPFILRTANLSSIPPWLHPTELQLSLPHHPCFDIFPDPVVRDNGIRGVDMLPHGILCMTLAGRNTWNENDRDRRTGMVIWGSPEDALSWEVTEGFVRSFGWLVKGSHVLECATNRWRWTAGEDPIFFA